MMSPYKEQIRQHFDRASQTYEKVAHIQKTCATHLVNLLRQQYPHFYPESVLDVGTGTGYVPEALLPFFPQSQYRLNDLSEKMLTNTLHKLGNSSTISPLLGDIETLKLDPHSLIISNFSLQWTTLIQKTLQKLYACSDLLVFSSLIDGTFTEWSSLFVENALPSPTYRYPSAASLTQCLTHLKAKHCHIETQQFTLTFPSVSHFMKYLQQLGANTSSQYPLSASSIRMLLNQSTKPFCTSYYVYFAIIGDI